MRDLAWALASPPLMQPRQAACHWYGADWYSRLYDESRDWLQQLDTCPDALQALLDSNRDRRLGRYFETLWAFYFSHAPRYRLLAHNQQVMAAGRTLGELDLIVHDCKLDTTLHIEVAVKFYLGLADTRQPHNWHGPGSHDRLDRKLDSLLQRQSVFARQAEVAEQLATRGIHIDACAVILKGRLFYPATGALPPQHSHPQHLRGRWLRLRQFDCRPGKAYFPQPRTGWLAAQPRPAGGIQHKRELLAMLAHDACRLPLLLLVYEGERESERLFIVPDDWQPA